MTALPLRLTAAAALFVLASGNLALAEPRPSIREAAARVSFAAQAPVPGAKDSNANGTAIGALVGAAGMGTMLAILWDRCDKGCENDLPAWGPYAAVGVGAAGGAAVGYFIDRARGGSPRKLAVAPVVTRRERGVKLAVRF